MIENTLPHAELKLVHEVRCEEFVEVFAVFCQKFGERALQDDSKYLVARGGWSCSPGLGTVIVP